GIWQRDGIPYFKIILWLESQVSRHQNPTPHLLPHAIDGLLILFAGWDCLLI
mgnify:CR=1